MHTLNIIAGAIFLMWGLDVVSHDLNTCKIPNTKIIAGLKILFGFLLANIILTISIYFNLFMPLLSGVTGYVWNFYLLWLLHSFLVIFFGVILWNTGVWPAGDAKFFIVLGLALPFVNSHISGFPLRTFFFFMVNIFVSSAFWAFGTFFLAGMQKMESKAFFKSVYSNFLVEIQEMRKKYKPWQILFILSGILVLFLVQRTISLTVKLSIARNVSDPAILFFFIFLIWDKLTPIFQKKWWIILSGVAYSLFFAIGLYFFPEKLYELVETAFIDMLKVSIFIMLVRRFAVFLMEQADMQVLYPEQLKPGMILSEKSRSIVKGDPNFDEDYESFVKDGLTPIQVTVLQNKAKVLRKLIPDFKIEVIKGRPFAGWILLGAVLTVLFRQNIAVMLFR